MAERLPARGRPESSQLRARAISRRRAPRRSQSLVFASLVVLGAFTGLALVWRQAWLPSLPRITVSLSREQEQRPPSVVVNPPPAPGGRGGSRSDCRAGPAVDA